jgi:predicted Fe-S protein YdhL (DUF1289 family)
MTIQPSALMPSPCLGICRMDETTGFCLGCARTGEEVAIWRDTSDARRREIWMGLSDRYATLGLRLARLPWTPREIAAFVADKLRHRQGSWAIGCYGAVAEFRVEPGEDGDIAVAGEIIAVRTPRGALRLRIGEEVRALALHEQPGRPDLRAIVLVQSRKRAGLPIAAGLASLGPDRHAMLPEERQYGLYDLGLGRGTVRFCIRAAGPDLVAALDDAVGQGFPGCLRALAPKILWENPVRVVETALGRAEIRTPIPPPGSVSPTGPHTHLLPELLALGHEIAPDVEWPSAYAAGAIFYPSPPAND